MSFNSRLGSSRVHRGRPSNKFNREHQGPSRPHEDAQPNELLRKRVVSGPPTVRSSAPQSHTSSWRGHHASRGRGRGNAPEPRRWSVHDNSSRAQPWDTLHENSSKDSRGPVCVGSPKPSPVSQIANVSPQDPVLPLSPADDPVRVIGFDAECQGQLSPAKGKTTVIHSSTPFILPSGTYASPSSSWPPPKRRKVVRSDQRSDNHRPRESPTAIVQNPSGATQILSSNDNAVSTLGQSSAVVSSASTVKASKSLASASDILLTDLSLPSGENTVTPLIPIPKRLKIIPIHPPSSISVSDNAEPSSSIQETHPASEPTASISSPQLSAPASMQVKRERSSSPSLAPRLITEGCVRITPLPPECGNRQPNFRAARQQLAAAEMKKLRVLGLEIVRVFTREDGMVIDWKSAVPVSSDTLRPPSPPLPSAVTLASGTLDVNAIAGLAGGGTMQPPAPKPVQPTITEAARPQIIQAEQPAITGDFSKPKKRMKQKHSPSGTQDSLSAVSSIVSLPTLPPSNKRRDPAPSQHAPPPAKKPKLAARPSAPRPTSDAVDPMDSGLSSIPAPPSHVVGSIALPTTLPPRPPPLDPPAPAAGLSSGSISTDAHPTILKAGSVTHRAVYAPAPPPVHRPPPPPPIHAPITSPPRGVALPSIHARALPAYIAQEELANAAIDFLKRYLNTFATSRASLAPAYSRTALFSLHTHTHTGDGLERPSLQLQPQRGRPAIVAALLAIPAGVTLCSWPPTERAHELQWDVGCVPGSASGDVLLACYAVQEYEYGGENGGANGRSKDKGKGKGKERAGVPMERWSCEQRFILRRRELDVLDEGGAEDEDDRNAAAAAAATLWPLVAVSHQMRVRLLP